jgi:hypothetical protein
MEGLADLISHFFNGIDPKPIFCGSDVSARVKDDYFGGLLRPRVSPCFVTIP